jgi:hypothetical protein
VSESERDERYREYLVRPLRGCARYRPLMGQGKVTDLAAFQALYSADPLYSWLGFDSPLMYAAHKAAGGMTSLYRQLGIGCEELWRHLLMDEAGLTLEDVSWAYQTPAASGRAKTLKLDGRLDRTDVTVAPVRERLDDWLARARVRLDIETDVKGVVFEVRQGYKSKDSKRQHADIDNASHALKHAYVPAVTMLSMQMDSAIRLRYLQNNWLVLIGDVENQDDLASCYAFAEGVLGYGLAAFFERNAHLLRNEIEVILKGLLAPA